MKTVVMENLSAQKEAARKAVLVWMVIVGALVTREVSGEWWETWWMFHVRPEEGWCEVREWLKRIAWIEAIHDQPAQEVFENLARR